MSYSSDEVFLKAIKKLPLLEELELSLCSYDSRVLELVAKECPQLMHFKHVRNNHCTNYCITYTDDRVAFAIAKMHGLRSLHLIAEYITNIGLTAILDNCPRLGYLNIQDCPRIRMDNNLAKKCACIIMDDYKYSLPTSTGGRLCVSPRDVDIEDQGRSHGWCYRCCSTSPSIFSTREIMRDLAYML
jgi:hypothetical protein